MGNRTLAQVANDRELAQRLISESPASYAQRTRVVLVSPCNEALKSGRLASHRLRGLDVPEVNPRAVFEDIDRARLDDFASKLGEYGLLVYLGRLAGLRLGESLGVKKSDFIDGGRTLRLQRQRLASGQLSDTLKARRAGEVRDIPVPEALLELVKDAPAYDGDELFPRAWRRTVYDRIDAAKDAAGLPGKFVPHWLRHSYASTLLDAGVPITDVSRWLGHKSVLVTSQVYAHPLTGAADKAREVLDASW